MVEAPVYAAAFDQDRYLRAPYVYLAMKRVYGQGWLKTFAKYWTLGWMYFWILLFSIPVAFGAALLLF